MAMTGAELRNWRTQRGWSQADLTTELDIKARQTVAAWENSEKIPRLVELAVMALDQLELVRNRSGIEKRMTEDEVKRVRLGWVAKHFEEPK
jgi:transcriptional regulator with XRE-family HTH domain